MTGERGFNGTDGIPGLTGLPGKDVRSCTVVLLQVDIIMYKLF